MKNEFENPSLIIVSVSKEDVIITSNFGDDANENPFAFDNWENA